MGSNPVGASEFFMGFILTASLLQLTARINHFHFQVSLLLLFRPEIQVVIANFVVNQSLKHDLSLWCHEL